MSAKTQYIMLSVEVPDKPVKAESILKIFENNPFDLLSKPEKQRCLWVRFTNNNVIWRSETAITNIETTLEGLKIKTRGELYYIHKCKQS